MLFQELLYKISARARIRERTIHRVTIKKREEENFRSYPRTSESFQEGKVMLYVRIELFLLFFFFAKLENTIALRVHGLCQTSAEFN